MSVFQRLAHALLGLLRHSHEPAPEPPIIRMAAYPPLSAEDRDTLIRTLYGEARGEPEAGQVAVVHVVRNRVIARGTNAQTECMRPYQFSCWLAADPNSKKLRDLRPDSADYRRLAAVVDRAWQAPDTVQGARHYYAASMATPPAWAKTGRIVARLGGHIFMAGVA